MKKHFLTIIILFLITSCNNRELIVDKEKLLATDYRLFQETPASVSYTHLTLPTIYSV